MSLNEKERIGNLSRKIADDLMCYYYGNCWESDGFKYALRKSKDVNMPSHSEYLIARMKERTGCYLPVVETQVDNEQTDKTQVDKTQVDKIEGDKIPTNKDYATIQVPYKGKMYSVMVSNEDYQKVDKIKDSLKICKEGSIFVVRYFYAKDKKTPLYRYIMDVMDKPSIKFGLKSNDNFDYRRSNIKKGTGTTLQITL